MTPPPDRPQLYHITHIDNLPSVLQDGGLRSDAAMLARRTGCRIVLTAEDEETDG